MTAPEKSFAGHSVGPALEESDDAGVFLLRDDPTRVLKVFWSGVTADELASLFDRWARLDHPNIVRLHDHGDSPDGPWILLERVDGASAGALLTTDPTPLDPDGLAAIAQDLLAGLGALHAIGLLHETVTPRDLLLSRSGVAKLSDPGLRSALIGSRHRAPARKSKPIAAYLAPELLKTGAAGDVTTDLYGAAATLAHLATGLSLFDRESQLATLQFALEGGRGASLEPLLGIDERWGFPLMRAFVDDPGQRFLSAEAFARAIPQPTPTSRQRASEWVLPRLDSTP